MAYEEAKQKDVNGKPSNTDGEVVKRVNKWFKNSWNYAQQNYHTRWERAWKLYNNQRVDSAYEGTSNVFVPMTFSTIEAMTSALAGGKPSFDFLPPQDRPDQKTDILNALIDYYWDKDQWTPKIESFIRDCLIYGTSVGYVCWENDHPILLNIPVRDFFFNPNATGIENTAADFYAGRRYLTTVEELESYEVVDLEQLGPDGNPLGIMKPKFKNLDQLKDKNGYSGGEQTDKEVKDMFYGSTVGEPDKNQVEVIEVWTEDKVCCVANRSVLIQEDENPHKAQARLQGQTNPKGIIPFIIQRDYADPSLFYGRGEVETIASLQEWLNDHTNQMADFMSQVVNPVMWADPKYRDMIEAGSVQFAPGVVLPMRGDEIGVVQMASLPTSAFGLDQSIKNEIRETTAASEVVKGVSSDTQVTATEINAQVAQAGARLKMKAVRLESEAFHRLARIVLEMVKLYVTQPMLVRVVTDTVSWQAFDPAEFDGNYEPRVQLETTIEAQKHGDMATAKEMYLALSMDPQINQEELKRIALPKMFDLDPDEIDRLLSVTDPMMGMDPMAMGPPVDEMAPSMPEAMV